MTTRQLALLTLALVLGTVGAVGWYLEGERTVQAAPPESTGTHLEHLWRSYPSTPISRRARRSSHRSAGLATSRPATDGRESPASAPWLTPARASEADPMVCGTPDSVLRP